MAPPELSIGFGLLQMVIGAGPDGTPMISIPKLNEVELESIISVLQV